MYAPDLRLLVAALSLGRTPMKYARADTKPTPMHVPPRSRMIHSALF